MHGEPFSAGCDQPLVVGEGALVSARTLAELSIDIGVDCSVTTVQPGLNIRSFPCAHGATSAFDLLDTFGPGGTIVSIQRFDAQRARWVTAAQASGKTVVGEDFVLENLFGYIIHARKEQTLGDIE